MTVYRFDWTATGTTCIEADSPEEAQGLFNEITLADLWSNAEQGDFTQDDFMVADAENKFGPVPGFTA